MDKVEKTNTIDASHRVTPLSSRLTGRAPKPDPRTFDRFGIDGWMVAWNPVDIAHGGLPAGAVEVGPWPDERGWSDRYLMTTGCCEVARHKWDLVGQVMMMFIDFHTVVVGDGVDPQAAHREFLKIDEYRRRISPDTPGAVPE